MNEFEKAVTARDALVLAISEKGFGNERAGVAIENLAKVGWKLVPYHQYPSPGPSGYSPDEFPEAGGVTEAARAARSDASEVLRDVLASLAAAVQAKITEAEIQCAKHAPMGGINYLCWFGRLAGLKDALAYIAAAKSKGGE